MTETLHVGRPNIGNRTRFQDRLDDIFERRWLSNNGPYVQELEARIAEMVSVRHCIAVCNATVGLQIALKAAGVTGQVIVPAWTAVATVQGLTWIGLKPVFMDVNERHNLDSGTMIEQRIAGERTGAILGVHLWGRPCNIGTLHMIAGGFGIRLIFDAAHAFGCSFHGRMIGGFGDAEVFSFHATKFINGFEGGAIVTNDDGIAERARAMMTFGYLDGEVQYSGTNGKMSEPSAAMVLTCMDSMDTIVTINKRNYDEYRKQLPGIKFVEYDEGERNNYHYVVIEIPDRDQVMKALRAEHILARRYFWPGIHRMAPYRCGVSLPETERLAACTLTLPTGTSIGVPEIMRVCDIIKRCGVEEKTMQAMPEWAAS